MSYIYGPDSKSRPEIPAGEPSRRRRAIEIGAATRRSASMELVTELARAAASGRAAASVLRSVLCLAAFCCRDYENWPYVFGDTYCLEESHCFMSSVVLPVLFDLHGFGCSI